MTDISKEEINEEQVADFINVCIGLIIFLLSLLALAPPFTHVSVFGIPARVYGGAFMILGLIIAVGTFVFGTAVRKILKKIKKIQKEMRDEDEEEWQRTHEFKYAG